MVRFPSLLMICLATIAAGAASTSARVLDRPVPARPLSHPMPAPRAARAAAARQAIAPPADQSGGRARKQGEGNVVIWPYVSFDDGPTVETPGSDASSVAPNVIVVGNVPAPGATPSGEQTLPDYSYVPGCRAIPNGYACDTHEHEAAP